MGTLNRAVTTVKKWFGLSITKTEPIKKSLKEVQEETKVKEKEGSRRFKTPQMEMHPTLKERRAKRREQGRSRNINANKH